MFQKIKDIMSGLPIKTIVLITGSALLLSVGVALEHVVALIDSIGG